MSVSTIDLRGGPQQTGDSGCAGAIFAYMNEHSRFMKAALGPKGDMSFQTRIRAFIQETMLGNSPESDH